jgi:hypothetical protein
LPTIFVHSIVIFVPMFAVVIAYICMKQSKTGIL